MEFRQVRILAWQKKGLNPAVAVIGGMLLGIFSPLMLFASTGSGGAQQCPHCAAWIVKSARTCPKCKRDVAAPVQTTAAASSHPPPL